MDERTRSRFRLTPALVVSAMVLGLVEKNEDDTPAAPQSLRPRQYRAAPTSGKPGCRLAFCRQKERCHCDCRKCREQCAIRDVTIVEVEGGYQLEHSDGEVVGVKLADGRRVAKLTYEDYEQLTDQFKSKFQKRFRPSVKPG